MKIGSHISFSGKTPLVTAIKTAAENQANSLMIFTGAPQNTIRREIDLGDIAEGTKLAAELKIPFQNVIVHAPYIINLANPINPMTRMKGIEFLIKEINRCNLVGADTIVLHPGSHLKHDFITGANHLIASLKKVMEKTKKVKIALETMAGKGSEIGRTFEELAYLIAGLESYSDRIGICLDTCHVHDAGYDLVGQYDQVIKHLEKTVSLKKVFCIHINDSKNPCGSRKDRHENIGYGKVGFEAIHKFCVEEKFAHLVKILETPFYNKQSPYKKEIMMLKEGKFINWR